MEMRLVQCVRAIAWLPSGDRLLLVQRSKDDRHDPLLWECPGGKTEMADMLAELIREIAEETNLTITGVDAPHLKVTEKTLPSNPKHPSIFETSFYECLIRDPSQLRLSHEHDAHAFVSLVEALQFELTNTTRIALEDILKYRRD